MSRMHPANCFRARLGKAEIADLTLADQICHRANRLLDRHVLVDAMLIIEIDMIHAESAERRFTSGAHVIGSAINSALAIGQDLVAELGRDYHLFAMSREGFANQLFIVAGAIDVRGVEKVYA